MKSNLPTKVCVVCERPFTWRKKWERCWDEVTTCSKRCNTERRRQSRRGRSEEGADADDGAASSAASSDNENVAESSERASRKAATKEQKAGRRAAREGRAPPTKGQKACDLCGTGVDLLIRCQIDGTGDWKMVCGPCWHTPAVANGVVDGDGSNDHYRYGGLWKNRKAQAAGR